MNCGHSRIKHCQRLIQLVAIVHIAGGIALPFLGQLDAVSHWMLSTMYPSHSLTADIAPQATFTLTLFGPTVASWGILTLALCNSFYRSPSRDKWWGMVAAVVVWCMGDSLHCLAYGVTAAPIVNGLVAIALLIPLLCSRRLLKLTDGQHHSDVTEPR